MDDPVCLNCKRPESEHVLGKGKRPLLLCPKDRKSKP